ncbi:Synaptic vesicle glycoprotein 2B [Nymphon striatum]|nr:Synaptic vesicle glycoprotein 2B [Nymphon striatum]
MDRKHTNDISRRLESRRLLDESDEEDDDKISSQVSTSQPSTSKPSTSSTEKMSALYQNALDALGFGRFHWLLLLVCGLANASDAVEILCVSLLLPAAQCDFKLDSAEKGWIAAIIFIGMMFGSYIWGALGDVYGRRNVLSIALLINGVFGGLSGLAQSFGPFLLMRFISGLGVGGSIPLVWSYFAEFQPNKQRASQMCLLAGFWMVGNIVTSGLGWLIIPHTNIGYFSPHFVFNSWRIFIVSCSIFSISSALLLFCFPKSPIFLMQHGHFEEAERVLINIYSINHGGRKDYELSTNFQLLFKRALLKYTVLMIIINFSIAFGYYGLWLWFPELFNRLAMYSKYSHGEPSSICNIPKSFIKNMTKFQSEINCSAPVEYTVFVDSFVLALSNLPGVIITTLFLDRFGRKYFLAGGLITSSICIFFIWLVKTRLHNLILSSFFGGFVVVSYNALNVISAELFPTEVRSTAIGLILLTGRVGAILGNVIFGYFIDLACAVPILLVAALLGGSGLISFLLPNTTGSNLK